MITKNPNLRFLLALGNTKMVVLKDEEDLHIYTNKTSRKTAQPIAVEHITEALLTK